MQRAVSRKRGRHPCSTLRKPAVAERRNKFGENEIEKDFVN